MSEAWEAALDDAAVVLSRVERWRMSDANWDRSATAIAALHNAIDRRDAPAVDRFVGELEGFARHRATSVGSQPVVEAPPPIRDRIARLIHAIALADRAADGPATEERRRFDVR